MPPADLVPARQAGVRHGLTACLALLLAALCGPGSAQSLGDVAAQEQARRARQRRPPAKTYTDAELEATRAPAPAPTADAKAKAKAPAAAASAAAVRPASSSEESAGDDPGLTPGAQEEQGWRDRAEQLREARRVADEQAQALDEQIKALMLDADPNAPDLLDPQRLQKREQQRQELMRQLEAARAAAVQAQRDFKDLEDEARRSRVPQAWLEPR